MIHLQKEPTFEQVRQALRLSVARDLEPLRKALTRRSRQLDDRKA